LKKAPAKAQKEGIGGEKLKEVNENFPSRGKIYIYLFIF